MLHSEASLYVYFQITNSKLIYLLYHEAKEAVIDGRYPLEVDEYDYLAGLQALIRHKGFNDNVHRADYYRYWSFKLS